MANLTGMLEKKVAKRLNEFELIARYFAPLAGEGAFGLLDDAALLEIPDGKKLVVTQDALTAGVHFFADDPPALIAKKALRVNISDLVAKGATPFAWSMALGLADSWNENWIAEFARGLEEDQTEFSMMLTGGDTFRSPAGTSVSITAFGLVDDGQYTSRSGAGEGDAIFVGCTIGDAALGLLVRQGELDTVQLAERDIEFLLQRYYLPQPALEMVELIGKFASAGMDISDGLLGDLAKLCSASKVGAEIISDKIPLSAPANKAVLAMSRYLETALCGGDDYELLFCIPQDKLDAFFDAAASLSCNLTRIGLVKQAGHGVVILDAKGVSLLFEQTSYRHF